MERIYNLLLFACSKLDISIYELQKEYIKTIEERISLLSIQDVRLQDVRLQDDTSLLDRSLDELIDYPQYSETEWELRDADVKVDLEWKKLSRKEKLEILDDQLDNYWSQDHPELLECNPRPIADSMFEQWIRHSKPNDKK